MIDILRGVFWQWPYILPIIIVLLFNPLINLKRKNRSFQFIMPVFTLIYVYVVFFTADKIGLKLQEWIKDLFNIEIKGLVIFTVVNVAAVLGYFVIKTLLNRLFKWLFKKFSDLHGTVVGSFYEYSERDDVWYLSERWKQARSFLKGAYYAVFAVSIVIAACICYAYTCNAVQGLYYPVIAVLILGDIYAFFNGLTKTEEKEGDLEGEDDLAGHKANYALLRPVLKSLFGDKVIAENTTVNNDVVMADVNEHAVQQIMKDENSVVEAYGIFIKNKVRRGLKLKQNYLYSGLDLLQGKSLLFNNPFYYDLSPYVFFAMNHVLLKHRKVIIILGRHGIEENIAQWCKKGITEVTGNPYMWNIDVLSENKSDADIGIITRSEVCDQAMHEKNQEFLAEVELVFIIEPSKLITTAQIGLNSIVQYCKRNKKTAFCAIDKNCDGLVDALSHILRTSITEVTATDHHTGTSSYMCWMADDEKLQHRMLPNISRYLGIGTELSFTALKHQVEKSYWYGGSGFPVVDMHWIAKQYYYQLLKYADLPTTQEYIDKNLVVSADIWNAESRNNHFMVVEDEAYNLFEARRLFASRAVDQGFVNIISTNYMLRDYMAANEDLFDTDSKAIPDFVADYDLTQRNVLMRLLLRMSGSGVYDVDLARELMLTNISGENVFETFWESVCKCFGSGDCHTREGDVVLKIPSKKLIFYSTVIAKRRRFSRDNEMLHTVYYLTDRRFIDYILGDIQNVSFVAEDEQGNQNYIGSEVKGQIFQKYLPGQYFVFDGKYYEMLRVTRDGQMLVRRAADHITGRVEYRQVRHYSLENITYSTQMGDSVKTNGIRIDTGFADISVSTPAYWKMKVYNDFKTAKEVLVYGIPERHYAGKRFLKIDFADVPGIDAEIVSTLTVLMNEVFKTIFAENQSYISVVSQAEVKIPDLYTVSAAEEHNDTTVYIIEDSQLDIGLLTSLRRNLSRIFAIICDYLEWQKDYYDYTDHDAADDGMICASIFSRFRKKKEETPPEQKAETENAAQEPENTDEKAADAVEAEPVKVEEAAEAEPVKAEEVPEAEPEKVEEVSETETETVDDVPDLEPEKIEEAPEKDADETGEEADDIEFEAEELKNKVQKIPYLQYGYNEQLTHLKLNKTLEFLKGLNYAGNELSQAREGVGLSSDNETVITSGQQCDFCGKQLSGVDYDVLRDGRIRCMVCSRNAIRSESEFVEIYKEVKRDLEALFGARIKDNIHVKMVNAARLHKRIGRTFVPTAGMDGRVLGVAIKEGRNFTLLIENGSPRITSMLTIAHELTHIWQYQNWNATVIESKYGKNPIEVYEGMAKWVEIQYAYLINEPVTARREYAVTMQRDDVYGKGFKRYIAKYPISEKTQMTGDTPFYLKDNPL